MKMLKATLAPAAVAAALLLGCGGNSEDTKPGLPPLIQSLTISTDGLASPQNVGILMAQKRGYFEGLGVEIWFRPPAGPTRPISYLVSAYEIDLAISHAPQVVISQDKGVPIVAIGSLVRQPTAAMIWLKKSEIGGIVDLRGKTIAFPGLPFQKDFLEVLLRQGGLTLDDVKLKAVGYELVPALASGEADAIFGGRWNMEGIQLKARGLKPVITRIQSVGVPAYDELTLIGRPDYLAKNEELIRNFLIAVARGNKAVIEDPEAAAHLVALSDSDRSLKAIEAEIEATLPLLSRTGDMSPERMEELAAWMHEQGLVEGEPSGSDLLTERYLPSQP
jgi:putative hydroxymethylpyrimidine transport system substrate-binding protein